jgi:hypothetical protein
MNTLRFPKWLTLSTVLLFISLLTSYTSNAQTGSVKGILIDSAANELVFGAIISSPENPTIGTQSDMDGVFLISNLKPGTYNFKVSYLGYKEHLYQDVIVAAGQTTDLGTVNLKIDEDVPVVEIIGQYSTNTEQAVVQEIREQDQVVSGISAEQISKSQDRDAAAVISRVPGVTLIDGRFIMIRGLSERYNNVLLNGAIAPSSESETRAFSFDILPSNVIDRILVFKSGAAEMPGDFAGGIIKVYTRANVDKNITSLAVALGYRTQTTFNTFNRQSGYSADWTTFGNKSRELPDGFPSDLKNLGFDYNKAVDYSKQLDYNWDTKQTKAMPDLRLNLLVARNFYAGDVKISSINNVSYSNVYQSYNNDRYRYWNYDAEGKSETKFAFKDQYNINSYRLGLMSNWSANFTKSANKKIITLRNFYTRSAFNEVQFRTGYDNEKTQELLFQSLRYGTNAILSSQLQGDHGMRSDKDNLTWVAGYSQITRSEPDWKRASQTRQLGSTDPFRTVVQPGPTAQDGASFFTKLTERVVMNSVDYSRNMLNHTDSSRVKLTLKVGYYAEYKKRDYYARWMSLTDAGLDPSMKFQTPAELFQEQNLGYPNGLLLQEGTRTQDRYNASNTLIAGYAGGNFVISKVTVDAGLRLENNRQQVESAVDGTPVVIDNKILTPLPFLNLSYRFQKKWVLRGSAMKTINRPEFRELSPFPFYDFNIPADKTGNPNLKVCDITNFDTRLEFYPSDAEMIAIGAFYKHFKNPIEAYLLQGASNLVYIYDNAPEAQSYGVEFELRKSLESLTTFEFMQRFSLLFNGSLIYSQINFGNDLTSYSNLIQKRAMQGQSPYVVNAGIYYNYRKTKLSALYNVYGPRIFSVGDSQIRTIYEMPRASLDVTYSYELNSKAELRIGISNLLNSSIRLQEDGNNNKKLNEKNIDKNISQYRIGQNINVGFVYNF